MNFRVFYVIVYNFNDNIFIFGLGFFGFVLLILVGVAGRFSFDPIDRLFTKIMRTVLSGIENVMIKNTGTVRQVNFMKIVHVQLPNKR